MTDTEKLLRAQGDTRFTTECVVYTTFGSFVAFSDVLFETDCFAQLYMDPGNISANWSLRYIILSHLAVISHTHI